MKIEKSELENGATRINLSGRLDIQGAGEIETAFAAYLNGDKQAVVVDMSEVVFLASIGIRLLLVSAKKADKNGGKMAIFSPQPMVKEALKTAGIDTLIPIFDDVDTASAAMLAAVSGS